MKLKVILLLVLLLVIAQGRRINFLNHLHEEKDAENKGEEHHTGHGEEHGESQGHGEENHGEEGHGEENHGEEGHGEDNNNEEEHGEENHGEEEHGEENNGEGQTEGEEGQGDGSDGNDDNNSNGTCGTSSGSSNSTGYDEPFERETCQGVIFDAGSSGTRVFVYSWPCRLGSYDNPEIQITQHAPSVKKNPGLSKQTVYTLREYFEPLLEFANKHVPEEMRSRTPILLGATAGMRIIEWGLQQELMQEVKSILSNSGYLFQFDDWARILSGKDEGAYLWLSVNYLKGFFNKENIDEYGQLVESYATIDIGGASTQLAEEIKYGGDYYLYEEDNYQTDFHTSEANIYNIDIYAHSWLYFGQDQAREQINNFLKNLHKRQKPIENPCYYSGQKVSLEDGTEMLGTGKPEDCKDLIDLYLIGFNQTCDQCAIQASYIPQIKEETKLFTAGSANFASKPFAQENKFKLSDFSFYDELCSKPFDESNKESYYPTQCFLGQYVRELIGVGYRVQEDHDIEIGLINKVEPSWTLAAMFDQIDKNESCSDSPHCNFRKHLRKWRKDRSHPRMAEHKAEKPMKSFIP